MIDRWCDQNGSIAVTTLILLMAMTILGISLGRTSVADIWISRNEAILDKSFYIAEGGVNREARELANGSYAVRNLFHSQIISTHENTDLPLPWPHAVLGDTYDFSVIYLGYHVPVKGFSARHFSQYDYEIDVLKDGRGIRARYYKIGPKAK